MVNFESIFCRSTNAFGQTIIQQNYWSFFDRHMQCSAVVSLDWWTHCRRGSRNINGSSPFDSPYFECLSSHILYF